MSRGTIYKWCPVQQKVVPADEVMVQVPAEIAHNFINDEMPPTKSPITGVIYTSKSRLREEYRAHGAVEIGNEYDHGYDPDAIRERQSEQKIAQMAHRLRDQLNRSSQDLRSSLPEPVRRMLDARR